METQSPTLKQLLLARWQQIYSSPDSKFIMRGDIQKRKIKKIGRYFAVLNETIKKKRPSSVDVKNNNVYMPFDGDKFNFNNITEKELLLYVNLDKEEVITKELAIKQAEEFLDHDPEDTIEQNQNHPIYINTSPICKGHSLLLVFPEQQLPQVIGSDVLLLVLNVFKLSPELVVCYNSLGASSTVNHLHLQIFYPQHMLGEAKFPIQSAKRLPFLKTSLVNPVEQVNMYSVGVVIEELDDDMSGFVLSPMDRKADSSQIFSSLSYVFGLVINQLLEENIPHNLIILDGGYTIYIAVRKFQTDLNMSGFLEISGVLLCMEQASYNAAEQQTLGSKLREIKLTDMSNLKHRLQKLFSIYK